MTALPENDLLSLNRQRSRLETYLSRKPVQMIPRYSVILSFLIASSASAQWPSLSIADTIHRACAWDSSVTIFTYEQWEAYQTLDSTWNGPRDTTICIDLAHQVGLSIQPRIEFDDIDVTRPVFVRVLLDSATVIPVDTNTLYMWEISMWPSNAAILDTSSGCPEGVCSGLMVAVRVADSLGTGSNLRWYQSHWDMSGWAAPLQLCMPTERMVPNAVREIVFKITPTGPAPGEYVSVYGAFAYDLYWGGWGLNKLTEAGMSNFQVGPADYYIGFGDNLVMYEDSTYPSVQHQSYLDLVPIPNTISPQTVTLTLDAFTSLNFQPFTQLRGGTVLGIDSIHHSLNVVNNGMDICISGMIIELMWEDGNRYTHQSGHIDFEGSRSCMLFGKGGTLCVAEGATLHYGGHGRGMMALKSGGQILIERNAELVMHGTMVLYEYAGETLPADIHMTLPEGAKLTFAPGSHIWNHWSIDQDMRLYVYLDGGSVDKSGLPPEEQDRVVVIDLPRDPLSTITVLGEAGSGILALGIASREQGSSVLTMIDGAGRIVAHSAIQLDIGPNIIDLNTSALGMGSYFVIVQQGEQRSAGRFVIL